MPPELIDIHCRNCGNELQGKFCHSCGQKKVEPSERTLKYFFIQFLGSAFFLENNFLKNVWYILARPGRQALDFIEGRQKRWMPPFSLFLLINLFYFWYTPLTDMNLRLYEQMHQFHGRAATELVKQRLETRQISLEEYAEQYNAKSSGYSNSLIILHVPLLALSMLFLFYRRDYFFVDYFIVGLYFMAFLLLMALILVALIVAAESIIPSAANDIGNVFSPLMASCLAIYTCIYLKNIFKQSWLVTIPKSLVLLVLFFGVHMVYRTILFLIIYAAT
jgi:hypothetical protein